MPYNPEPCARMVVPKRTSMRYIQFRKWLCDDIGTSNSLRWRHTIAPRYKKEKVAKRCTRDKHCLLFIARDSVKKEDSHGLRGRAAGSLYCASLVRTTSGG